MNTILVQNQNVTAKKTISFVHQNELFEQYVIPYSRLIYWMCIKYSYCCHYIDDNYNEVLLNFYKSIHTYNPERGDIKTWLCVVASRLIHDLNKKHSYIADECDLSQIADDFFYYDVEKSIKADYLTNYKLLFSDDILWALDKLNHVYRETLLLYLAGYTMQEIANISHRLGNLSNKNINTVKSRLKLARTHMGRLIDINGKRRAS